MYTSAQATVPGLYCEWGDIGKKKKEKAIKHMKEMIQDLKTEIETIKKTQAEGIIETEIMRK